MLRGLDSNKDQTYFLSQLSQEQIKDVLFPVGDLQKEDVRRIAEENDLATAKKKDSTGICFIGERDFNDFLSNYLPAKPGNIVDTEGNILGKHQGLMYHTIGQRRGLGLSLGRPVFVIEIRPDTNEVVVGNEEEIFKNDLIASNVNFIAFDKLEEPMEVFAKVRYLAKKSEATIYPLENSQIKVSFKNKQRAITKGQSVVFYTEDYVVGGGVIEEIM